MPTPELDTQPETDTYTDRMVTSFRYIQKGSNESGQIPLSEIYYYYKMFKEDIVETKHDFIYLIYFMNQAILEDYAEKLKKVQQKKAT